MLSCRNDRRGEKCLIDVKTHCNILIKDISQLSLSPLSNVIFALSHDANIVQRVKSCYKIKSVNRF